MDGTIEVRYAGVVVGQGTVQPSDATGAFVAFADPLPVGTVLELSLPTGSRRARVEHVVERGTGAETGMRVRFVATDGETAGVPETVEPETSSSPIDESAPAVTSRQTMAYGVTASNLVGAALNPEANGKPPQNQGGGQQRSGKKKRR